MNIKFFNAQIMLLTLLFCFSGNIVEASNVELTEVDISFNVGEGKIFGSSTITVKEPAGLEIFTGNLVVKEVKADGKTVRAIVNENNSSLVVSVKKQVKVTFEGNFPEMQFAGGVLPDGVIKKDGIFLTGRWYPSTDFLTVHKLAATVPKKFVALSEADKITGSSTKTGKHYRFDFPYPVKNINFAAAEYTVVKSKYNNIEVAGYFLPGDVSLAKQYISQSKKYLAEYESILGPYPYKRFAVVENFLPTGYSMPTFTLLGRRVIRLPFIAYTSLGHEIAHQWVGNSVYADYMEGNWLEGLTTFLADYQFEKNKGGAVEYRKKAIVDYISYVNKLNDMPVKDFRSNAGGASQSIGYGKVMFIFHMLLNEMGEEKFYETLKELVETNKFKEVSWIDLAKIFNDKTEKDLSPFFKQWTKRKGLAHINVVNQHVMYVDGKPEISFDLIQVGSPYNLKVPVEISTESGVVVKKVLDLNRSRQNYKFVLESSPLKLVVDKNYDIFRKLSVDEIPLSVSRLIGDEKKIIIVPPGGDDYYDGLISVFKSRGFVVMDEKDVKDSDLRSSSFVLLGTKGRIAKRLFGKYKGDESRDFSFTVIENPLNSLKVMAVVAGVSSEEFKFSASKVFRYGKYSSLTFKKGRVQDKKMDLTVSGLAVDVVPELFALGKKGRISFDKIIEQVKNKKVVYVGEMHDKFSDHRLQLNVIRKLHERGVKVAIGMEMFQAPSQVALDKYISNKIGEKEFLRESEYFTRWNMDYILYSEIINYAKAYNIPVVALNIDSGIFKKVGTTGIDSLTDVERQAVPEEMDMSDMDYKEMLKTIFSAHGVFNGQGFERFYQSQVLWDEVMAHGVTDFLKNNSDYTMVVVAGSGHISYNRGIVNRVKRIAGFSGASIISTSSGTDNILDSDYSDYVVFTKPIPVPTTPKLGVYIEENKRGVKVEKFVYGGVAKNAGVKKGDIIISIGNDIITTIADLKVSLHFKKKGDKITVIVIRKKFFGEKEVAIEVVL